MISASPGTEPIHEKKKQRRRVGRRNEVISEDEQQHGPSDLEDMTQKDKFYRHTKSFNTRILESAEQQKLWLEERTTIHSRGKSAGSRREID